MRRSLFIPTAAAVLLLAGAALTGCSQKQGGGGGGGGGRGGGAGGIPPTPVQVTPVKLGTVTATVPVVGNINALDDVQVSARVTARVATVTVREGDTVRKGQLLVQQDTTDLEATVRQDQAAIQADIAAVDQARSNLQIQIGQARAAVNQARAQVAAAQQNYSKLKGGNRPEQIAQAQAQALQAKANLDNARTNLARYQQLFQQGAVARADLDTAQTTYNVDVQLYNNAQQAYKLSQAGYQQQDIAAAQEQVREQVANLKTAQANLGQVAVRKGQIEQAQATVSQARQKLAYDQEQLAFASVRSPMDGIVAAREVDPGQVVSPGTNLIRVVDVKTVYYEPTISETDFAQVSVGNPVNVNVDALPGKTYVGKVAAVYPAASTANRVFSLRVVIPNPSHDLRPGMYARGNVMTQVHRNVVVVPVTALVASQAGLAATASEGSEGLASGETTLPPQEVFLVGPGNKAVARPVKVGIVNSQVAEVLSGLQPGARLITNGQGLLQPGAPVRVINGRGGQGGGGNMTAQAGGGA